jgi:WhiB family transcriptional regulator, redox-sensing transcriptional regulator
MAHGSYNPQMPGTVTRFKLPCHGTEGDFWFASDPSAIERAKALCQACPLQRSCLAGAEERREPWGVWGGELFQDGAIVAFKRPRGRPRKDAGAQLAS